MSLMGYSTFIERTLDIAKKQVGVREKPGNRGREVAAYLAAVGLGEGHPWCAAFVIWCIREAGKKLGLDCPLPRDGRCQKLAEWAAARRCLFDSPAVGDVFVLMGSEGRFSHTGFVAALGKGSVETIEGNTNEKGGREGVGVFKRKRKLGAGLRFVRWG